MRANYESVANTGPTLNYSWEGIVQGRTVLVQGFQALVACEAVDRILVVASMLLGPAVGCK